MTINISFAGIQAWLRSKNWTAHTVAIAAVAAATAVTTDQQVRDFVLGIFQAHPAVGRSGECVTGVRGVPKSGAHAQSSAETCDAGGEARKHWRFRVYARKHVENKSAKGKMGGSRLLRE